MDKVDHILLRVRNREFGTPKNPKRETKQMQCFWNSYFNMYPQMPAKDDQHYKFFVAGRRYREMVRRGVA